MMCMSITPFTPDGVIDEVDMRQHLRRMVDAGVGVYLGSPGSGEGHSLTRAEVRRVYDIGVEECRGKVPVCANPREARNPDDMLTIVREAIAAGVDVVQIYQIDGGHGFRPRRNELSAYFRDVLAEIDHPVALGCNPVAGFVAPVDLLADLCREFSQVVALNIVETPPAFVQACRDAMPGVDIFVGQTTAVQGLALGARGVLSAAANVIPRTVAGLATSFAEGDVDGLRLGAQRIQRFYAAFVDGPSGPRWEKTLLKLLGLPGGNGIIRRPYVLDPDEEERMRIDLERLDVRTWEGLDDSLDR
jgi:4-hydroxy-tetrahydrodipicolinate synthase